MDFGPTVVSLLFKCEKRDKSAQYKEKQNCSQTVHKNEEFHDRHTENLNIFFLNQRHIYDAI